MAVAIPNTLVVIASSKRVKPFVFFIDLLNNLKFNFSLSFEHNYVLLTIGTMHSSRTKAKSMPLRFLDWVRLFLE